MANTYRANLVGKKFGRLTVISLSRISKQRQTIWLCRCDCGNEKTVSIGQLKSGHTKSCGCLRHDTSSEMGKKNTIGIGKASANSVLYGYKKSAKIRNLSWELTDEDVFELLSENCYYCGSPPSLVSKRSSTFNGSFTHNGIDRKDNTLGYIKDNCVPCCKNCNYAKRNMNYLEFKKLIKKIYENLYGNI